MIMSDESSNHLTDDEDLLARYVLGQLHVDEITALEKHLERCKRCADAVVAERLLAAGLKRAGREGLKQRIAARIAERRTPAFSRYKAVGIAAAIVLLVTIAIRYDWFTKPEIQEGEVQSIADTAAPSVQPAAAPQAGAGRAMADAAESTIKEKKRVPAATSEASRPERDAEARKLAAREKAGMERRADAAKEEEQVLGKQPSVLLSSSSKPEELWVEGTLIRDKGAPQYMDRAAEVAEAKNLQLIAKTQALSIDTVAARFAQRPLSALPQTQQRMASDQAVQTLFRQSPAGLHLTLFSEPSLDEEELQEARLRAISADSLLLIVGTRQIGYKLPPGWLRQQGK